MKIVNLKTGEISKEYNEIFALNGYSVFFEEKRWGVLDPQLKEFGHFKYHKTNFDLEFQEEYPQRYKARERFNIYFSEDYQYYFQQQGILTDSVLITRRNIKVKEDEYGSERYWPNLQLYGY